MIRSVYILRFIALLASLLALGTARAQAQSVDAALLVADSVLITEDERLVASGNVEAFYEGTRIFTDKIIYDQEQDVLIIENPVRVQQANGDVFLADSADLDSKLENGILLGARYVLNQELQILSAQTDRVEARYTVMRKVVATSCQVCGNGAPIWQIRADRAIHDREEKQLFFRRAQFRLLGVPVLYLPRLRIPDPSLKRATGFLVPKLVVDSQLGFGLKVPYFIKIGDHADLTVTPFITQLGNTVELRYRKMFRNGYIQLDGAVTEDQLLPNQTRSYLTGYGVFNLANGFTFSFDVETTSDAGYRSNYGYSGRDRLGSGVKLTRARRNSFFNAELLNFETLRDNESNDTQPTIIGDFVYERRFQLPQNRGELRASAEIHGHRRESTTDIVGRDMTRVNFDLSWRKEWTIGNGMRFGLTSSLGVDNTTVANDSLATGQGTRVTPAIAATLRYPFQAKGKDGAQYLLEPIAQIGWAGGTPTTLPNDESVSAELDEGNLLSLSRFPAKDRRETGVIGAVGLRWARQHSEGWSMGVTVGQVFKDTADPSFTTSSGLNGLSSNTLLALQFTSNWGGSIQARGLFDAKFDPVKTEAQIAYSRNKLSLSGNFVQLRADAAENRTSSVAEWSLSGSYKINRHWTATSNFQYDLLSRRAAKTGGGLVYENECMAVSFGVTRSFASSTTLVPVTQYQYAVALRGFSTGGSGKGARRTCRK